MSGESRKKKKFRVLRRRKETPTQTTLHLYPNQCHIRSRQVSTLVRRPFFRIDMLHLLIINRLNNKDPPTSITRFQKNPIGHKLNSHDTLKHGVLIRISSSWISPYNDPWIWKTCVMTRKRYPVRGTVRDPNTATLVLSVTELRPGTPQGTYRTKYTT